MENLRAAELRIGNFVQLNNNITQVDVVDYNQIIATEFGLIELKYIKPIPLTEEWLLKFGFKKQDYKMSGCSIYKLGNIIIMNSFRDNGRKDMGITVEGISPPTWSLANLYFIHHLQNLYFALTGEELIKTD